MLHGTMGLQKSGVPEFQTKNPDTFVYMKNLNPIIQRKLYTGISNLHDKVDIGFVLYLNINQIISSSITETFNPIFFHKRNGVAKGDMSEQLKTPVQ